MITLVYCKKVSVHNNLLHSVDVQPILTPKRTFTAKIDSFLTFMLADRNCNFVLVLPIEIYKKINTFKSASSAQFFSYLLQIFDCNNFKPQNIIFFCYTQRSNKLQLHLCKKLLQTEDINLLQFSSLTFFHIAEIRHS